MKIDVLDLDPLEQAAVGWRLSRDLGAEVGWAEVFDVDVPVNELPSALLHFRDFTILEREIFFSSRSHVAWARTSHVDDPLKFVVPEDLDVAPEFVDNCRRMMKAGKDAGQSQDEWRSYLPVLSTTSWTSRMSFRDLVKMASYFYYICMKVGNHGNYAIKNRLRDVYYELAYVIDKFTGSYQETSKVFDSYSKVKYLYEGDLSARSIENTYSDKTETNGLFVLHMHVPLWLRAQIVRHRNLIFADDLWHEVVVSPTLNTATIGRRIRMEIAVSKEVWRSIVSKRSCWLAQDSLSKGKDAWQEILDGFGWQPAMLPCHDGHCPYHKDAALRLTDADPGAPCPRYLNIKEIDQAPYRERIAAGIASRHSYWREEIK